MICSAKKPKHRDDFMQQIQSGDFEKQTAKNIKKRIIH
jgi:hypothetical protein